MRSISGGIDGLEAVFDDGSLVADAGLLVAGTVMGRLGLEALIDDTVRLDGRGAGSGSGRKVLSLVASLLVGGCCIDGAGRLRSGASQAVLPFRVMAPSTVGSFLRSFTLGHVRRLDKAAEQARARAWSVGAAPGAAEMTVDLDSTLCEVCGKAKHGAAYGHTHPPRQLTVAATVRNRLLAVPARLVNHSGRHKLRLPADWPWATAFTTALQQIRNLPLLI